MAISKSFGLGSEWPVEIVIVTREIDNLRLSVFERKRDGSAKITVTVLKIGHD
jgi:hypothetical protein